MKIFRITQSCQWKVVIKVGFLLYYFKIQDLPSGQNRQKSSLNECILTIWHSNEGKACKKRTPSDFFWRFCPLGCILSSFIIVFEERIHIYVVYFCHPNPLSTGLLSEKSLFHLPKFYHSNAIPNDWLKP